MAEPVARKELELRMKVVADTSAGTKALAELGAAAERAAKMAGGASAAAMGVGGGPGSPGGMGAGGAGSPMVALVTAIQQLTRETAAASALKRDEVSKAEAAKKKTADEATEKKKAGKALEIIRDLQLGGIAGYAGQIKGYGEAGGELAKSLGFEKAGKGIEGLAGKSAVPLALLLGAGKLAGQVGEIMHDSFSTDEQKGRAAFRKFVPFGETIQDSFDGVSGRRAGMEKADFESQQRMAGVQSRLALSGFEMGHNFQQAGLDSRAASLRGASPILEGAIDRSAPGGEKAFKDRMRLLPLEREAVKAEREAAAAAAQRVAAVSELTKLERKSNDFARERAHIEKNLAGSGVDRQIGLRRIGEIDAEAKGVDEQRKQAAQQVAEAKRGEAQSNFARGMVDVRRLQTQAGGLEEDAAKAAGGARKFGQMNRFDRQEAIRNLELLKKYGPEALDPSQVASAMSIAPETAGKIVEKAGAKSPEFAALEKLAPDDIAGDPEELKKKAREKRDEAAKKELELESRLAGATAAAGRDLGKMIADVMKDAIKKAMDEILNQMRIGKNAR